SLLSRAWPSSKRVARSIMATGKRQGRAPTRRHGRAMAQRQGHATAQASRQRHASGVATAASSNGTASPTQPRGSAARQATRRVARRGWQHLREARQRKRWVQIGVVVVGVLALGFYLFWPRPQPHPLSAVRLSDDPALGPANAPVTIIEYGDFYCP